MKKSILLIITVVSTLGLTAFVYTNWNNSTVDQETSDFELYYNVSNRWSTITKADISNVRSLSDLLSKEQPNKIRESFKNVRVDVLYNDKDVRDIKTTEIGQSKELTEAQVNLLNSIDYSTNIRITALNRLKIEDTAIFVDDSLVMYMTIIPEKEAEFEGGFDALINYLKENTKEKAADIQEDKVQPGKVFFTVTAEGTIEDVKLVETSGYEPVDKELLIVTSNMPEKWTPAKNSKGEKVAQEFVFWFGSMGC